MRMLVLKVQVLEMINFFGLQPNLQTFSIIMDAWCSAGLVEKAKSVLQQMLEAGISADVTIYGILVKGYVRARDPQTGESVIQDMRGQGLAPNAIIYTTIISGWCNAGRMDDALRIYTEMVEHRVAPNLRTFQTLIWGFRDAKLPSKAEEVLQLMEVQKVSANGKVLEMIADAWRDIGLDEEASRFLISHSEKFNHKESLIPSSNAMSFIDSTPRSTDFSCVPSSEMSGGLALSFDAFASQKQVLQIRPSNRAGINKDVWKGFAKASSFAPLRMTGLTYGSRGCSGYIRVAERNFFCASSQGTRLFCGQV